jgi:class 3 adenylate cyclase
VKIRDTRYAKTPDGAHIAYQTTGDGPIDLVWQLDWFGNVDVIWEDESFERYFTAFARFSRLILHDRRATGLSTRNVPVPSLETRVADLRCVLDAVGATRPVLGGLREGASPNALLAATEPDLVRSLIWEVPIARLAWAPDYPWGVKHEYMEADERALEHWGTAAYGRAFIDAEAVGGHDVPDEEEPAIGLLSRHTTTPDVARELGRVWYETDIRDVLRAVRVPTLLIAYESLGEGLGEAEYVASIMPEATLRVLPVEPSSGAESRVTQEAVAKIIREFVGAEAPVDLDTVLSTILFTDIVGSTARQAALGDRAWKELIERHHEIVRRALTRWHGVEHDTAGDGFYATFDGPARAIRCGLEITERVRELGVEVRAGVHTGECEIVDGKHAGITVSIGARVANHAGASEVLVSQTVKDLVAGSGLAFDDAGEHELKGVPDRWRLYRVAT